MTNLNCKKVINKKILDYSRLKGYPVQWDNVNYEPTVGKPWLSVAYNSLPPIDMGLGANNMRIVGMVIINIRVPTNTGTKLVDTIESELMDIFQMNGTVRTENGTVNINNFYSDDIVDDIWFMKSITIEYTAFY